MRRYIRAFFIALRMTLRGETLPPPPHAPLREWIAQGLSRVEQVEALAARQQINLSEVVLHLDMRDIRMSVILNTIRHHLTTDYPLLLRTPTAQSLNLIYANNLDDHYRVSRLEAAPDLAGTPLQNAVAALAAHLEAIPQQN
ncbi:MAG TPA: hypothetical protein VKY59_10000 [Spirillospora sp.]|jgi:hypothetical protein|nr:hypothetical protein [Spirillospora sp.]